MERQVHATIPSRRPSDLSYTLQLVQRNLDEHVGPVLLQTSTLLTRSANPYDINSVDHAQAQLKFVASDMSLNHVCAPQPVTMPGTQTPHSTVPGQAAPQSGPHRPSLTQQYFSRAQEEFAARMYNAWNQEAAPEAVEEGNVMYVRTYYTSPQRMPTCFLGQ